MVMFIKDNGPKISKMVMVVCYLAQVFTMKATLEMVYITERVL